MNILHTEASMNWGGQEYRIIEQIQWLLEARYRVGLAAHPKSDIYKKALSLRLPVYPVLFRGDYSPKALFQLRRIIKREGISLVDAHSGKDAATASLVQDLCPVIRSLHVMRDKKQKWYRRYQWRYGSKRVIATAHCIKEKLVRLRYQSPDRIDVVGEWASPPFFRLPDGDIRAKVRKELGLSPDVVLFAVIGMLREDKGQIYFIRAAHQYLREHGEAHFLIVGAQASTEKTPYQKLLQQEVEERKLSDYVHFLGYRDDVPRLTSALDALVITSTHVEAQSRTVPQAFASKTPVVASRVGGVPELVQDGKTGWLVDIGDVPAYVRAMMDVVSNRDKTYGVVEAAYRYVCDHLTLDKRMQETLSAYHRCLNTG